MAKRSYVRGIWVGLIGIGACGGVAAGPDGRKDSTRSVQASAGSATAGAATAGAMNGADPGGSPATEAAEATAGIAGSSPTFGGARHSDGGASSSVGGVLHPSAGAAATAVEPPLSDCMPADARECTFCTDANGGERKVITGDVDLTTQAQVDALQGVVEITGSLKMQGDLSLRSLHALCCLEKIDGSLVLQWMYDLGNVDGLSSLTQVGGDLSITHSNCSNINLKGLGSLKSVGGDFEVEADECYLLTRIGVQNIAGHITHTSHDACPP